MSEVLKAFHEMTLRPVDADYKEDPHLCAYIEQQIWNFPTFALPHIHDPVAICGLVHFRGIGEIWMVTGAGFERQAPVIVKQQRSLILSLISALNLHRLDMEIDARRADAKLYAEKLGFEYDLYVFLDV